MQRRKSPTKKCLPSTFRELTGLCGILLDGGFTLEVLETSITEERKETESAVQSKNGRRRFRKNWLKTGKRLEEIRGTHTFNGKESYLKLIPKNLGETFLFRDFHTGLKETYPGVKAEDARIMLWCLCRMGIVVQGEKKGRFNSYSLGNR